jgi:hypothetical protein
MFFDFGGLAKSFLSGVTFLMILFDSSALQKKNSFTISLSLLILFFNTIDLFGYYFFMIEQSLT